jgi:hypothetical protein
MKHTKPLLVILFCLLAALPLAAQAGASSNDIKVFAVNLHSAAVDIQLGSPAVFQASALAPYNASKLTRFGKPGAYPVTYRFASGKLQLTPRNQGGQPLLFNLTAGKTYLIRVLGENSVDMVEMPEPAKASVLNPDQQTAKIAFFNATANVLSSVQVASATNTNVLVSVKDLAARDYCNFGTVNYPGEYGCFWLVPNQSKDTVLGYLDGSGKPIMTKFVDNSYWALVIWPDPKTGNPAGSLFDITPR